MGSFSIWHWLILLVIVMLVFGTKKLGNIGSDLGKAVKGFKDGVKGEEDKAGRTCSTDCASCRQDHDRRRSERENPQLGASSQLPLQLTARSLTSFRTFRLPMIDIGLTKMMLICVVALVVIGPEKLPKVARMAGSLFGRAQRYINDVKAEVSREMELEELRKFHDDAKQAACEVELSIASQLSQTESELNAAWSGTPDAAGTAQSRAAGCRATGAQGQGFPPQEAGSAGACRAGTSSRMATRRA